MMNIKNWSKKKKIISASLVILLIAVAGGAYFVMNGGEKENKGFENQQFFTVEAGTVENKITLVGTSKIVNEQKLRFNRSGKITNVYVKSGENVKKGDLLVQLDNTEARSQIRRSQIQYQKSARQIQSIKNDHTTEQTQNISQQDLENQISQAKSELSVIKSEDQRLPSLYKNNFADSLSLVEENFDEIQKLYEKPENEFSYLKKEFGNRNPSINPLTQAKLELNQFNFLTLKKQFKTTQSSNSLSDINDFSVNFLSFIDAHQALTQSIKSMASQTDLLNNKLSQSDLNRLQTVSNTIISNSNSAQTKIQAQRIKLQQFKSTEYGIISQEDRQKRELIEKLEQQLLLQSDQNGQQNTNRANNIADIKDNLSLQALEIEQSKRVLEQYQILAPFDGIIRKMDFQIGDNLIADDKKFVVIEDPNLVEIQGVLDQYEVVKAKAGITAEIVFNALPDNKFTGIVSQIDSTPSSQSGESVTTYPIKIEFDTKDQEIYSGLLAKVEIFIEKKENVLRVPTFSVMKNKDGTSKVRIKNEDGSIDDRIVEIGLRSKDFIEIISGLELGEEILEIDLDGIEAEERWG